MREKKKLVVRRSEVYNNLEITRNKYRGACVCRLRGSNPTSTLLPDADNAAVGSHRIRIFYRRIRSMYPPVLLLRNG